MLNKSQSKKRNSWKLYVVIPALVAFVVLFQVEVIAKEKREISKEVTGKNESVDVYKISKTTTDQELKEIAEKMKLNHDVDARITEVERNSNNELIAIRFDLKRGSKQSQSYHVKGSKAIKDCEIIIETESDGSKKIGLKTEDKGNEIKVSNKENKVEVKKVQNSKTETDVKTNNNTNTSVSTINSTNTENTNVNAKASTSISVNVNSNTKTPTVVHVSTDGKNTSKNLTQLVVIDGVISNITNTEDLENLKIGSVNVLTGDNATDKYGDQGKNGVLEIKTK
jgi:hypothetical protein